jgi:ribosomal protein S27AE
MEVIKKSTTKFTCIIKCPKCGIEIIADHKEDLI